jgi:hypothetical protein
MSELKNVSQRLEEERVRFEHEFITEKEKSKRLLYLFQRDLMPGISGQILESKGARDEIVVKGLTKTSKLLGWSAVMLCNAAMLFYIMLFALSQEVHRQRAWARSFGMWLVMEVLVASSCMVFVMHVLIPSLITPIDRQSAGISQEDVYTSIFGLPYT